MIDEVCVYVYSVAEECQRAWPRGTLPSVRPTATLYVRYLLHSMYFMYIRLCVHIAANITATELYLQTKCGEYTYRF